MRQVIGSAASFLLSAFILHHFALLLDPSFSFFLTRGVGKAALMLAAIMQAWCFVAITPNNFYTNFVRNGILWPLQARSWRPFLSFFGLFALAHIIFISSYVIASMATYQPQAWPLVIKRWPVMVIGALGTFLLAWSEELLFRGLLYNHFARTLSFWPSAVLSSVIFSLLHDLSNPLNLVASKWQLGLGLFLLGMLLTSIRVRWQSLAASAGAHAGLVYIKVILRKVPLLPIAAGSTYWFPVDLRESLIVHGLLIAATLTIAFTAPSLEKSRS